jgi:hypothetical protein
MVEALKKGKKIDDFLIDKSVRNRRRKARQLALSRPPNEKVFQDFPAMSGRKWLVANLTIDQSIYNFWPRTHLHHLVERLAVGAFKLIVEYSTSSG